MLKNHTVITNQTTGESIRRKRLAHARSGLISDYGGVMKTIAANLGPFAFEPLDAPPVVVGSRNWITPCAEQEDVFFPPSR